MRHLSSVLLVVLCLVCAVVAAFGADSVNVVVLAPKTLYSGGAASLTITTVNISDQSPVDIRVIARLDSSDSGSLVLFDGRTGVEGHLVVPVEVPVWDSGVYSLVVEAAGVDEPLQADVEIRSMPVILIGAIGGMIAFGIIGLFAGAVLLSILYKLFGEWLEQESH